MEKHVVIDQDGSQAPYTPAQARDVVRRAVKHGDIVLAVCRTEAGDLACHVFGPPSEDTAALLDQLASAYRKALPMLEHKGE